MDSKPLIQKVKCECGKLIKPASMPTHLKSKKHVTYLENPTRIKCGIPTKPFVW